MKKIFTSVLFITYAVCSFAQQSTIKGNHSESSGDKRNLMHSNQVSLAPFQLVFGIISPTYERGLSKESSVGVSLVISLANGNSETSFETNRGIFSKTYYKSNWINFTPYYRYYFGKYENSGFFAEGFSKITTTNLSEGTNNADAKKKQYYSMGLGGGIGSRWVTKKGVSFEFVYGIGRNLFQSYRSDGSLNIIGRSNVSIGYRF